MGTTAIPDLRHMIVELWQPNERWHALDQTARRTFLNGIALGANAAREGGVEVLGWGALDRAVSNPAAQCFCGVFFVNDRAGLHAVDQAIRAAGWYEYFDHVNVATELHGRDGRDAEAVLCTLLGVE